MGAKRVLVLVCGALVLGLPSAASPEHAAPVKPRILVFTKTAGFRHESIPAAVKAVRELGVVGGFAVDVTEDSAAFSDANLTRYDAVVFLLTTGDVLNENQEHAFERSIRRGRGFAGVHSAADTEYGWAWYGGLVGAYFQSHPQVQSARVGVVDRRHASTARLPRQWVRTDEWYNFARNPRADVHVLATVDEASYAPGPGAMGPDHPVAWAHRYQGGRAWYTAGGHREEAYSEPLFRRHLLGGIRWAAGLTPPKIVSVTSAVRNRRLIVGLSYKSCRPCVANLVVRLSRRAVRMRVPLDAVRGRATTPRLPAGRQHFTVTLRDPLTGASVAATRRILVR